MNYITAQNQINTNMEITEKSYKEYLKPKNSQKKHKTVTKYAIIINELKFGTINQPTNKLFDTEEQAQDKVEQFAQDYITAMKKLCPQNQYNYEKTQRTFFKTNYYNNKIFENGKLAFYFDILPFEI